MKIIEQSHDEKVAMYMKSSSKLELAEMLVRCNEVLDARPTTISYPISNGTSAQSILPERFY